MLEFAAKFRSSTGIVPDTLMNTSASVVRCRCCGISVGQTLKDTTILYLLISTLPTENSFLIHCWTEVKILSWCSWRTSPLKFQVRVDWDSHFFCQKFEFLGLLRSVGEQFSILASIICSNICYMDMHPTIPHHLRFPWTNIHSAGCLLAWLQLSEL